ncbi:Crp/Fnr family transcriptional regulator [Limnohabitans sp.]|jgi:CRP-like cAMP-binding protein|uniref:Crp/Fnr family transcriptional regulator n=1 Tax=Limnohabitans sp. TaxID=1907725 RepID=UPI0037C1950B
MSVATIRPRNQLLGCLPETDWARLIPLVTKVDLPAGESLIEAGTSFSHVYFPLNGLVALHGQIENGNSSVLSLVGPEGFVGVSSFMGGLSTTSNATVFSAGSFLRMRGVDLLQEFERSTPLLHLLLRYTQALITQMAQTSVCNRHHTVDNAFSRFLLLSLDRSETTELLLTHEKVAHLLGVRREGVSEAAMRLQRQGLIRYSRGRVQVLDRAGMEGSACECYQVIKTEYDRLLPLRLDA